MVLMARIGVCVVCVASVLNSCMYSPPPRRGGPVLESSYKEQKRSQKLVCILVQTYAAPNAFRTSILIQKYMTEFAMDQVCDQPRPNVLLTV